MKDVSARVVTSFGSSREFHHRDLPDDAGPVVSVFVPERTALILGSTQNSSVVDENECRSRDIEIVERRSGGGIVLLSPESTVWIDVELPRSHPLWINDVGESALWLGETIMHSLQSLGCDELTLHREAMVKSKWSSLICFAGRGPGEVFTPDGRKVVGISQRRTRDWARFQSVVSVQWKPELLVALLHDPRPEIAEIVDCGSNLTIAVDQITPTVVGGIQTSLG